MKILSKNSILNKKIAYQFTFYVILLSFIVTLLSTCVQLYIFYQEDINRIEQRLDKIHDSYLQTITYSLWHNHQEQIPSLLEGILHLADVQYISLEVKGEIVTEYGRKTDNTLIFKNFYIYSLEKSAQPGSIGTLHVVADIEKVYQRLFNKAVVSLSSNAATIFLVALFILWIFHFKVARHLNKIADYAEHIDSEHLDTILKLDRPHRNNEQLDELEHVVVAINRMRLNLQQSYKNIQESEQNTQNLLNATLIGLGLWRLDGTLVTINPAYAQILGRSEQETLKLNYWRDIVVEADVTAEQAELQALKAGERYGPIEKEYRHRDGYHVPVRLSALIIKKEGEYYAWSNVENIIKQKWAAMELQSAKQKAEEASLAKSQFLANMSHELRTPMNTIVGYAEILEEEIKDYGRPNLLRDIKSIHAAAKHLLGLVDGILDISKIEAGRMQLYIESFDLKGMIQNTVTTIQPLIENKANVLQLLCDDNLGHMHTDLTKVRQILFNLLSNASKFTEQGIITLMVKRYQKEDDEDWITLRVSDDGVGMTSEQQANLFQIFTQADASTSRKYGGSGLGLAITKHFTQMLGGHIQVESEFGKGSCFIVQLPVYLAVDKGPDYESSEVREPEFLLEAGIVLVIDDDESVRQVLETYLSKVGYQVAVAANGKEGLKLAKKLRPDAITLDVMMPGMDGWEVLSALKAEPELAHIPVIMLTMIEDQDIGYSLGAAEYLTKPISRSHLINVLRKYRSDKASCTVLLIEDDLTTREMMVRMLHKSGWKVIEAENGEVALQRLQKYQPDLILLDLMMPKMDGFEFIIHLRQHADFSSIPIVVLTAKDITEEDRLWLNSRVDTVFQKGGYNRDELFSELRRLLVEAVSSPYSPDDELK